MWVEQPHRIDRQNRNLNIQALVVFFYFSNRPSELIQQRVKVLPIVCLFCKSSMLARQDMLSYVRMAISADFDEILPLRNPQTCLGSFHSIQVWGLVSRASSAGQP